MATWKKPQFRGERAQTRADQGLLLADNDALCWVDVQEYEKVIVDLYPASLVSQEIEKNGRVKYPIPHCGTGTVVCTEDLIVPEDIKTVGMDACIVLETKHGGERDAEAVQIKAWDNDGSPMLDADNDPYFIHECFGCLKRFVRLRAIRLGAPTFSAMKVVRGNDTQ